MNLLDRKRYNIPSVSKNILIHSELNLFSPVFYINNNLNIAKDLEISRHNIFYDLKDVVSPGSSYSTRVFDTAFSFFNGTTDLSENRHSSVLYKRIKDPAGYSTNLNYYFYPNAIFDVRGNMLVGIYLANHNIEETLQKLYNDETSFTDFSDFYLILDMGLLKEENNEKIILKPFIKNYLNLYKEAGFNIIETQDVKKLYRNEVKLQIPAFDTVEESEGYFSTLTQNYLKNGRASEPRVLSAGNNIPPVAIETITEVLDIDEEVVMVEAELEETTSITVPIASPVNFTGILSSNDSINILESYGEYIGVSRDEVTVATIPINEVHVGAGESTITQFSDMLDRLRLTGYDTDSIISNLPTSSDITGSLQGSGETIISEPATISSTEPREVGEEDDEWFEAEEVEEEDPAF